MKNSLATAEINNLFSSLFSLSTLYLDFHSFHFICMFFSCLLISLSADFGSFPSTSLFFLIKSVHFDSDDLLLEAITHGEFQLSRNS